MNRLTWLAICIILLLLVACVPGNGDFVTWTPEPTPTAEGPWVPTPTPDYQNPHKDWPPFTPVNKNPTLEGAPNSYLIGDPNIQQRRLYIPPLWSWVDEDLDRRIPPYSYQRECDSEDDQICYQLEPAWIEGDFGLAEDNIPLQGDTRYIVKVRLHKIDLQPTAGNTWVNGDVGLRVVLYVSDGTRAKLIEQALPQYSSQPLEYIWVIESTKLYPTVRLETYFTIAHAAYTGIIWLDDIEILTAPADFGDDAVKSF